jgi:prepilin signal peptidase PulO-like enzyme (type II secretory pathway)
MSLFHDAFTYYVSGSILMFMLGIAAGNYVTSIIYRLPKGLVIANDPPYCECEKRMYLSKRDLFPFFSWFLNKGQCRFCDIRIPVTYTIVEFLCGFLFVTNWITLGMGEDLVLVLGIDALFIGVAAIYYNETKLFPSLLFVLGGTGAVYRTLQDGTIMEFVSGGYLGLMLGVILWCLEMAIQRKKIPFPDYAIVIAIGGLCVGREQLIPYFIVAFIIACLISCLGCLSERFKQSAWVFGVTISVIMAMAHG